MRKNNHHSIPTTEVKSRVKMWRSGKNWVYGLLFFFGMAGISFGQANLVHADTTELSTETEKGTIASQLTDRAVPLQTSVSKSADDSTNTATSASEPDISGTNAEQTDKTVETSAAEANGSDTTDTTAPTTDSESTTAGEQTKSATTESPVSDPVNLSTTDSTDTTGATDRADSSTATKSDATPVKEQSDSETASSSDTTTTTSPDETTNTETPTTDQTESSASSETSSTPETQISDDSTASVTEDASSTVDTSSTPLPEVSYKSMLSAEQVATLSGTSGIASATDNTSDPATTNGAADQTTTSTNGLPEGFSVTDPDYPAGTFHHTVDDGSGLYSFFEGVSGGSTMVLSIDRETASEVHVETIANGKVSADHILETGEVYKDVAGYTVYAGKEGIDSVWVQPTGATQNIIYDLYSYLDHTYNGGGYAVLKPFLQEQTTRYVDQNDKDIATSVTITGLSRQKYTTGTPGSLSGYTSTNSGNTSGLMSPFMNNGQTFDEELYSSTGTDRGTLTYTVTDVDAGILAVSFVGQKGATITKAPLASSKDFATITGLQGITSYNVPYIFLNQTTSIKYKYAAESAKVDVNFVDENGNSLTPEDPTSSTLTMLYNEETEISPATIKGYTYNEDYQPTANDNPKTYTVTDIDNPGEITLHYIANSETVTVKHVDANNNPIGTKTEITGKYNETLTIASKDTSWIIDGYQAIGPDSYTFGDGDQIVTVQYEQTTDAKIKYVVDHTDGTTTDLDVSKFDVPTELTGVLGNSVEIDSPEIPGYTAVSTTPINYTFTEDGPDVTLHYTANEVGVEVDFVDSQTGATVRTPIKQTVNAGAAVQIKLTGADHIPVLGYVFPQTKVPDGGNLDLLADGSIVINMTAPADGVGKAIVYLVPTKTVDATDKPVSGASDSNPNKIYRLTNRVVTITTTTPDGSEYTATNGTQTVTYKRQYTYDVYIGPDSALTFGEWKVSGDDLAAITSASPDGYTKTITLSTNGSTPVTMTDDDAVNTQIQKDLTALLSLPKNGMLPNETTEAINIAYTATDQTLTVHFINKADNSEIGTQIFSGKTNSAIDFSALKDTNGQTLNKVQEGYVLVDDETSGLTTFAATDQEANIYYTPITGTYTITTPEGDVTENHWTTDPDDPSKLAKVTVPTIENYTPVLDDGTPLEKDPNTGNYVIPAPTAPNTSVSITYHEDTSSVTVDFTDYTDPSNAPWPSQTFSGEPGKPVKYSQDKNGNPLTKYHEGYLLLFDGTLDASVYGSEAPTVNMGYMPVKGNYEITPINGGDPEVKPFAVDPETPTQYLQQTIPVVEGYTAVIDHGDNAPGDIEVDPDDPTQYLLPTPTDTLNDVKIKYIADQQQLTVHFKMPAGATVPADVALTGESGSDVVYADVIKSIAGYVYVPSESDIVDEFDYDSSTLQTTKLVYKAVGDYTYTTPGTDTPTTTTYTTDQDNPSVATGHIPYTPGFTPQIDSKDIPLIDKDNPSKGYDFTPADPTQPTTITYAANEQKLTVHFKNTKNETIADDVTVTGGSATTIEYDKVAKLIDGYVYDKQASTLTNPLDTDDDVTQEATLIYKASGDYTYTTPGTDTPTTTTYTTDPEDPSAVTGHVPYTPGYTPQINGKNIPLIDKDNPSKGYDFMPADPTQPTTITYAGNEQKLTVHFETADGTEISGKVTLTGASGGPVDYSTVNKQLTGYILTTDGTLSTTKYDTDDDQDQSVILTYAALVDGVTVTTPTGEKTTTPYTNDSTEPKDPKTVDPITIAYVPGYTPSSDNGDVTPVKDPEGKITGYTLIPNNPTKATSVTYHADSKNFNVVFVDQADLETPLKPKQNLSGVTDGDIDYTTVEKVIDGYVLVTDPTEGKTKFAATDNGETLALVYKQIGNGVTLTTPDPDDPDGQQITKTYTNDPTDPSTVLPIDVPYIAGYTPTTSEKDGKVEQKDPDDPTKGYTFTPSNPAQPANVTYNADQKSIQVAFVSDADKQEIAGHPAIELRGVTDGTIDYTKINKLIDGYVLVSDGTKGKTTFSANDDGTPFTILYNEIGTGLTLTTPDPHDPNGQQTTKAYTNDPENPSTVLPIDVPYIAGYTPSTPEEEGVVEPKDPKDLTKGYTFTPSNPAQPANVTYNADSKNLNVVFVEQDDPETPLKPTQNLSGVTDGNIDYTTVEKVINGYVLLSDETVGKTKFTATDNGEDLTLTYQKTAGGYVGKTPAGVDLTTPYVTDPEDPKAIQPITIPTVPGYTLDVQNGKRTPVDDNDPSKGYTVTPLDPSKPTTVTYTAEAGKSVQVAYVDENGVEISGHPVKTISGQTDQTIDYGTKAIAGYILTADGTTGKTTFAATDGGTLLTISYEKIVVTITKPTDDGNTETVPVDTTTPGHVDYIPGYTPKTSDGKELTPVDGDKTKGYTVPVPDDPTTKTTINYEPNVQTAQVILVDTAGNPVTNDEGQSTYTFHGVTGQGIHEWEVDKKAAAYTISEDGTLQQFVYDNVDGNVQVVKVIYLKTSAFNDPDGGTTTLLTDGSGKVVSIDKKWGTDGDDTNVLIENGVVTLTPNPDGTPRVLKTDVPDGDGTVTGTLGKDGNIILTQKIPDGVITETITPDGQLSFSQVKVPAAVSPTPEAFFNTQTTHDPDGGTTTTKTNGHGDITAIDRNWPDGDRSHVVIDIDTGIATITETPKGGSPSEPVAVQPGITATVGKTTLDNHDPINLTHAGTDGDSTIATITPDGKRTFTYTHH